MIAILAHPGGAAAEPEEPRDERRLPHAEGPSAFARVRYLDRAAGLATQPRPHVVERRVIRAESAPQARAMAAGRVVFSDRLRGFGNLLIVSRGDQYLSIHGNNESVLKRAGDTVQTSDALATGGNSGGNSETGLYFEPRYRGKPFEPLSWASLR